jgi:hypothetical protein
MPAPDSLPPAERYTTLRASAHARLVHLALPDIAVTLCGRAVRDRAATIGRDADAVVCACCDRLGELHPLDRDPPGNRLAPAPNQPSLLTAADPSAAPVGHLGAAVSARVHAWRHARSVAHATARLRRDATLIGPGDLDTWRVIVAAALASRWRRASTIRARDHGFLADLDDTEQSAGRRFASRAQARRWIVEQRVVHG